MPLPCIVKPCSGGSSIGVRRVLDRADVLPAVEEAFKYEDDILIESFVNGREITCGVLGDTALPPAEVIPKRARHHKRTATTRRITRLQLPAEEEYRESTYAAGIQCRDCRLWAPWTSYTTAGISTVWRRIPFRA